MEINEKFKRAKSQLEHSADSPYLAREISVFRGKLYEEECIKMFLEAGVEPNVLEQKICEYFWSTFFKLGYHSSVYHKESENRAGVAPSDFGLVSIDYLKERASFWSKECDAIEAILLSSITNKYLSEEEQEKISKKIFETMKSQDQKEIAKCNAIDRYCKLTKLKQIKENIRKKNPQKISFESMTVEEIDSLYEGKKK